MIESNMRWEKQSFSGTAATRCAGCTSSRSPSPSTSRTTCRFSESRGLFRKRCSQLLIAFDRLICMLSLNKVHAKGVSQPFQKASLTRALLSRPSTTRACASPSSGSWRSCRPCRSSSSSDRRANDQSNNQSLFYHEITRASRRERHSDMKR